MLVVNRRPGESVVLDGGIQIVSLGRYKIGIDAPKHVRVVRSELVRDANGITPQQLEDVTNGKAT